MIMYDRETNSHCEMKQEKKNIKDLNERFIVGHFQKAGSSKGPSMLPTADSAVKAANELQS